MFSDYVIFADESGDHGLARIDPDYPVFVLSFCLIRKDAYCDVLTPHVRKLKMDTFGHDMVILHEHDIRKRAGAFSKLSVILFEARGPKEDETLALAFRRVCDGANSNRKQMPFDIVIADKRTNSEGLQVADLMARPIGLSVLRPGQRNRAMEILDRKFARGIQGKMGIGLKVFP